jgi:hypothetical protein
MASRRPSALVGYGPIRSAAKLRSKYEARRIAVNFAKLPRVLSKAAFSDAEPTYAHRFSTAAFATQAPYAHIFKLMDRGGVVLRPVKDRDHWRVQMTWPVGPATRLRHTSRYFGQFNSEAEAERWIAEHRWFTQQKTGGPRNKNK